MSLLDLMHINSKWSLNGADNNNKAIRTIENDKINSSRRSLPLTETHLVNWKKPKLPEDKFGIRSILSPYARADIHISYQFIMAKHKFNTAIIT